MRTKTVRTVASVALLMTGCAAPGRPLAELLPVEAHAREVAGGLAGEYRELALEPQHRVWLLAGDDDRFVGYDPGFGRSLLAIEPPGRVDAAGGFEVGARVTLNPALPAARVVSMALHAAPRLDRPGGEDVDAAAARADALAGRLPEVVRAALARAPLAVQETVAPLRDGRTHRWATPVHGADLEWSARWFGRSADLVVSIVIVDVEGGVSRVLVTPTAIAR